MYLKSLEMHGFKSFPDKTVLNFDKGATIVVGPNGSGKSNISDAMKWVLGEISSRNIRGTKMEDVIFGGTDTRRAMSFSEVSVTIDNTDIENRMDIAYNEVTVTRRYYRSGESEYFMNQKSVRLKDIHELFMNTGIGRDGYSIIGQGKISEIISQKGDERRSMFEEAAGISKYKYKKVEAEKKLLSVDENLVRIKDILHELEERVIPLEKESAKARKYLEYYEEKKKADISLWIYNIETIKSKIAILESNYTLSKHELEMAEDTLNSLENQNEKIFLTSQENKLKLEQANNKIKEYNDKRYELESTNKVSENEISHLHSKITESINSKNSNIDICKKAKENCKFIEDEYQNQLSSLHTLESDYEKLNRDFCNVKTNLKSIETEIESNNEYIKSLEDLISEIKIKISVIETSKKLDDERKLTTGEEIEKYNKNIDLLYLDAKEIEIALIGYTSKIDSIKKEISKYDSDIRLLNDERVSLKEKQNNIFLEHTSKQNRIEELKRMEELFEGYAQSVRFIMSESEKGILKGIYSPISKLITVESKYSVAIETALGPNIQSIVVENEIAAKNAIVHLKDSNAGRATFYPITSVTSLTSNNNLSNVKNYTGCIGIASELVKYDIKFENIIKGLLARTVIFDNINNATIMAQDMQYKVRVITLDGQVINAGGSFTGGAYKRDSGMITRLNDIEKIKTDLERIEVEIETYSVNDTDCDNKLKSLQIKKDENLSELNFINTAYQAENMKLQVLDTQVNNYKTYLDNLTLSILKLNGQSLKIDEEYEDLKLQHKNAEIELNKLQSSQKENNVIRKTIIDTIQSLQSDVNFYIIKTSEVKKDIDITQNSLKTSNQNIFFLDEQIIKSDKTINEFTQNLNIANSNINQNYESIQKIIGEIDSTEERVAAFNSLIESNEKRLLEIRSQIKDKSHTKELFFREFTKLEARRIQTLSEQDNLTAKLWESYELTYTTALEFNFQKITEENRLKTVSIQAEYKNKIHELGPVNVSSIDEYIDVKRRFDFLNNQVQDLNKSKENLVDIIYKLENEMRNSFIKAMEEINHNFQIVFRELFGGGTAEVLLTDQNNVLTSGIEINVAPPGKIIKNMILLSGGEQAFVAIALFFAILQVNPTPFCILDEIEAALDDANVERFAEYVKRYSSKTQFILITHRRGTMEIADRLYGVTMYERGISKILTLNINEVEQKIGVKL